MRGRHHRVEVELPRFNGTPSKVKCAGCSTIVVYIYWFFSRSPGHTFAWCTLEIIHRTLLLRTHSLWWMMTFGAAAAVGRHEQLCARQGLPSHYPRPMHAGTTGTIGLYSFRCYPTHSGQKGDCPFDRGSVEIWNKHVARFVIEIGGATRGGRGHPCQE